MIQVHEQIEQAFRVLEQNNIPTTVSREVWKARLEELSRPPTEEDRRYPHSAPVALEDHLGNGNRRPELDTSLVVGRAYSLSPAMRDVIRDTYNMTPTELVQVIDLQHFENPADALLIKTVTLRSEEHVDSRRVAVMTKFTITSWGKFMARVAQRGSERANEAEYARMLGRVMMLVQKAKDAGVITYEFKPSKIAVRLQSEIETGRLTDPKQQREILRQILTAAGFEELAELVKDPKYFGEGTDGTTKKSTKSSEPKVTLAELMKEYEV